MVRTCEAGLLKSVKKDSSFKMAFEVLANHLFTGGQLVLTQAVFLFPLPVSIGRESSPRRNRKLVGEVISSCQHIRTSLFTTGVERVQH